MAKQKPKAKPKPRPKASQKQRFIGAAKALGVHETSETFAHVLARIVRRRNAGIRMTTAAS